MTNSVPTPVTLKGNLARLQKRIADCQSLYPDSAKSSEKIIQLTFTLRGSYQCLQLLYISSYFQVWETDILVQSIANKAYRHSYNGKWETVQEFLEAGPQTPEQFAEKFISLRGPHDFFGPFLECSLREMHFVKIKDMTKRSTGKVVYPIYRRGYKDKGTLRPNHKSGRDLPGEDSRVDRRHLVGHPLLRDISRVEECVQLVRTQREEEEHANNIY